ncbi:MAG TPA: aminotransferase class IV [Pyrinomonadaceae bacterium]|nr:aminotransferase class IV [Pyrinomonadaceae bacterium]
MHTRIILNNRLIETAKARLPPITGATLHGRGVFTTLAVFRGKPFLWPEHWARLVDHAARAGVDSTAFDEETISSSLRRLIEANEVGRGRARVMLSARDAGSIWNAGKKKRAASNDLIIITGDARPMSDDGLALTISPYRTNTLSPLAGVKSLNYLEHVLAWEEARARDFDEALVINERGEITSATMGNIFWVTNGALYTPALSTGALNGTTRARVISLAEDLSVPHVEGVYDLAHLGDADEIFLTSSGLGVAIVTAFDFRRYTVPAGSIALRLREAFRQLTLIF